MKLAVVGSRTFKNKKVIFDKLSEINEKTKIKLIISGGAIGVDSIAVEWAKINNIPYVEFIPNWRINGIYDPVAGFKRNSLIIDESTHVIAFWHKKSGGTLDSINKAKKQNKILEIVEIN